ncbi:MAG: bis(5'-nucleosyl)-tetraphosphatase (symmetrical) YqeK [Thermoleophilia bacterium]
MEKRLKNWLQVRVSDGRYIHSVSVMEAATELARHHGVDPMPLRQAALLHDCAREYSNEELVASAEEWQLPVREVDRRSPVLLHGKLAVVIAEREFGLDDPAVLSAVRWHTAGHPEMTLSDKLFYLADVTEPTCHYAWVAGLRALAHEDVDQAVLMAIGINTDHLDRTGRTVDPDTYDLRDLLLEDHGS